MDIKAPHALLFLRSLMVFFCCWILVCGAIMASHYKYGSRDTLVSAIVLDALLMIFCIFLIVDVPKQYYLQFPALKYITITAVTVATIVAWMITTSATVGLMPTLTVGNAWHTVTCLLMDSMTQFYASGSGGVFYSQRTRSRTTTQSSTRTNTGKTTA